MSAPHTVNLEEAKARLDDLIERVHRGEEWLITDSSGLPVAKLAAPPTVAAPPDSNASLFGVMPGIKLLPGWDEPLEEFAEHP